MTAIGFELWTMQNDIMFDNIYIGHSEAEAEEFAKQTWVIKNKIEMVEYEKNSAKEKEEMLKNNENSVGLKEKISAFAEEFKRDPGAAFKKNPLFGTIGFLLCAFPFLSLVLVNRPKRKTLQEAFDELKEKDEGEEEEEKKTEAIETDNVEENVTSENLKQRTTKAEEEEEKEEKKDEE